MRARSIFLVLLFMYVANESRATDIEHQLEIESVDQSDQPQLSQPGSLKDSNRERATDGIEEARHPESLEVNENDRAHRVFILKPSRTIELHSYRFTPCRLVDEQLPPIDSDLWPRTREVFHDIEQARAEIHSMLLAG
jgi:hypothetical protein